jgi:hypothetical protein
MKRQLLALAALTAAVTLTGCAGGPPSADDPRDGRVTLAWSNCATGSCIYDWKVCIGPDLLIRIAHEEHWWRASPECEQ